MSIVMETPGITFTVQWKKNSGTVNRQEDVTSIGLWDPDDCTLEWQTFKSYVCQNLGTVDNISVAYVDSEGDELPIESECEFLEALKFARQRAQRGQDTILKVDRQESEYTNTSCIKISDNINQDTAKSSQMPSTKVKTKTLPKSTYKSNMSGRNAYHKNINEERKSKENKNRSGADNGDLHNVVHEELLKIHEKLKKVNVEQTDVPPLWFRSYMQKMKSDIVQEVTISVLHEIQQVFAAQKDRSKSKNNGSWSINKDKKKKGSDEESSDGTLGYESRDNKLLKKIEKLHKREKKLEKKLDSKLEKLENKTKRMVEKRSQCKARCERISERKLCPKRRSGDLHFGTYLMDAILLNDGPASEITILPGQHFTKVWEIMNAGTLPWTDKTELRQAWGTSGLESSETVVKCPILQPGERGTISMRFRAPEFPGKFKSYWHFYHMGDRFGHWIGCAVVVKDVKDKAEHFSGELTHDVNTQNNSFIAPGTKKKSYVNNLLHQKNKCEPKSDIASYNIREEYECDFESDNLSVISGPGSESSDSEDENFVVIPMPACFACDVPLGQAETVPVMVKCESKESKFLDSNDNAERDENNFDFLMSKTMDKPEQYEDKPLEKIYAVDSSGCCIAVKYSCETSIRHAVMEAMESSDRIIERDWNEESSPCGNTLKDQKQENKLHSTIQSASFLGSEQTLSDSLHPNSQSNNWTFHKSKHPSAGSIGRDPLTNVIHILPETLVTGAVNVATSAYSTARAVISNLQQRTRQYGGDADWQWSNLPEHVMQPTDITTSEHLEQLLEMGFSNRILNVLLLQRYDNDITKVVAELVSYEE